MTRLTSSMQQRGKPLHRLSLKNISDNNAKLHKWFIKLSGLDYSISYIKGELNIVADYPSRAAVVQAINLIHHDVLPIVTTMMINWNIAVRSLKSRVL